MTAPIDVLAVMEEARALAADQRDMHDDNNNTPMGDSWESFRADVVKARAAIAELIQKAETAEQAIRNLVTAGAHPNWTNYADDLRAALANVSGGA